MFNVVSARAIAEFNLDDHSGKTPLGAVAQLLLDACIEIERLEREQRWPEPAALPVITPDDWHAESEGEES